MVTPTSPEIECTGAKPAELDADLLVIPVFEDDDLADLPGLDSATGGEISRALAARELTGQPYEVFVTGLIDRTWRARRVAGVGAGTREAFSTDRLRKVCATAGLAARQRRIGRVALLMRSNGRDAVQAAAEGLTLANFETGPYKTSGKDVRREASYLIVVGQGSREFQTAAARGCLLGHCSNLMRALANEPSNFLTPRIFAERSAGLAAETGIAVEVLDERAIAELKLGLLMGVARGSAEPPRVIVLRYEPPNAPPAPVLGLVGKGITFDSGGISIKPADGMERMKDDMAGGAAVVCALRAMGVLRPSIRVVGVVPTTENMPGGRAVKPGDILTSASGKTVEVVNTDAEGRLILADALWYARHLGATHLVDIATLTGACMVALGKITTGLFGTPEHWVELVRRVADREGDRCWPMPVFDEYADQLRSEMADLVNSGGRPAGAITAALFLKEFTGGLPWAHLDIAGTAWSDEVRPYLPKGATGVGVRTLAELPFTSDAW